METGFATAMPIKPQWLRDIVSILATGYYLIFARAADEKVQNFNVNIHLFSTYANKLAQRFENFETSEMLNF